tara:strand:- start:8229 stop:10025 length:1797 start_codon:yes stop_codon:yes gene_type:complete
MDFKLINLNTNKNTTIEQRILTNVRDPNVTNFHSNVSKWLSKPDESFFKLNNQVSLSEYNFFNSKKTIPTPIVSGKIILIQQFYIPDNKSRLVELQDTLKYNCHNNCFDKIVLLNEKIYTNEELGTNSEKIEQINISTRLTYKDVFNYTNSLGENTYVVLANADIFFDASVGRVRESGLTENKKAYTLLRHEFNRQSLKECELFGPRCESQDAWIWNSKWKIPDKLLKTFNMNLGLPGCDNKIIYLLSLSGFECYNEPEWIKCFHNHETNIRNYGSANEKAKQPYFGIFPSLSNNTNEPQPYFFNPSQENNNLKTYIENKFSTNKHFIIPRMAGIENEITLIGISVIQKKSATNEELQQIQKVVPTMKNNAGILLPDINSVCNYSQLYLNAFHKAERYFWWAPWGNVSVHIPRSWDFIVNNFKAPKFDALTLDIFHHIQNDPWTLSLRGKRILIISSFIESIQEKINIREKIYGIDLFPDCEFVFLKPPQTHGSNDSQEFTLEFEKFVEKIQNIKDTFDVALCSCGGYGNPICSAIYDMDKSAIYVGGVLQMYFGIYGERWMRERPDVLRAYMNDNWSRPKEHEKPDNHKNIEKNCYW